MPQTTERRRHAIGQRAKRAIWGWVMETHLETLEKVWLSLQVSLAGGVLVLQTQIVGAVLSVNNRPLFLPAAAWTVLLLMGAYWQWLGAHQGNHCMRRNGALCSFVLCCALVGPLWTKGPFAAVMLSLFTAWQATVAARLWWDCSRKER